MNNSNRDVARMSRVDTGDASERIDDPLSPMRTGRSKQLTLSLNKDFRLSGIFSCGLDNNPISNDNIYHVMRGRLDKMK